MKPKFRIDKATQAAALFLKFGDKNMNHLKLIKLLYLTERESLLRWGHPLVYDSYVSMDNGPVLSQTLNYINGDYQELGDWGKAISPSLNYEVKLKSDPGTESLSEAEEELIKEIFASYGEMTQWELVEFTHKLPEWENPKGSSKPIQIEDILRLGGKKTAEEIESIMDEIDGVAMTDNYVD